MSNDRENLKPKMTMVEEDSALTSLEAHAQSVLLQRKHGDKMDPSVVGPDDSGEILADVIVELKDPEFPVKGLSVARKMGSIVTGAVAVRDIHAVSNDPNVIRLVLSTPVHPHLDCSVEEIEASSPILDGIRTGLNGAGVVVGVIDYSLDFAHPNFRNPDGTTRIVSIWDQRNPEAFAAAPPTGFQYGREISRAEINDALARASTAKEAYEALRYEPEPKAHGTHVADIAAGNGRATKFPGVAPAAEIVFVHLAGNDVPDEDNFGGSRALLEAIDYIFSRADELRAHAVVNMSLGTHGGPHDGTTPVEKAIDQMLQKPGRAVVMSAGNSYARDCHAAGTIEAGQKRVLTWRIAVGDPTPNELEVWHTGQNLAVTLTSPEGDVFGPIAPGKTVSLLRNDVFCGRIIHRAADPVNALFNIDILVGTNAPPGSWRVQLQSPDHASFNAWIERDDRGQSRFAPEDADTTTTLGSISCGRYSIAVGAYSARSQAREIGDFSAGGPTADGRHKPEVSAPGVDVSAACATTSTSIRKKGTSMAAPHVTGLVALLMQAANRTLTIQEIRKAIMDMARTSPPATSSGAWHPRYGLGRISARSALRAFALAAATGTEAATSFSAASKSHEKPVGDANAQLSALLNTFAGITRANKTRTQVTFTFEP